MGIGDTPRVLFSRRQWIHYALGACGAPMAIGCQGPPAGLCDGTRDSPGLPIDCDAAAATFEVRADSALLALYVGGNRDAHAVLSDSAGGLFRVEIAAPTAATGFTTVVQLSNLAPATWYRYYFALAGGTATAWYHFRTAPSPDQRQDFRFAFSADVDLQPEFDSEIFGSIVDGRPDFFLSLGDFPYADNWQAVSESEFHKAHRTTRLEPRVQQLVRAVPLYAIYDDHEVRNDWDGATAMSEPERVSAGLKVWDDWFPLHDAKARYRCFRYGALAEFFVLDTRAYRSANAMTDGPEKTMLGAVQRAWLLDRLERSTAPLKFVVSSVPLDYGTTDDHWASFRFERELFFDWIDRKQITGVIVLAADQHWFAAHHYQNGIREFQVGPLARGTRPPPAPAPPVQAQIETYNYGEFQVVGGNPVRAIFTCRDSQGRALYSETVEV